MRRGSTPPIWFVVLVAAVLAVTLRALAPAGCSGALAGGDEPPLSHAWFAFVVTIASAIWKGVEVAAKVSLQILQWSVKALWAFAVAINNAVLAVGKLVLRGLRKAWDFLRATYEHVLKPAWQKFWKLVDTVKTWLEKTFKPLVDFLMFLRKELLGFYAKWIRPILDIIGLARRVLSVLSAFGLEWAKTLDRKLRELEERIDAPFRYIIAELNKVLGWINRIITADGLFQRLTLIRTLERDFSIWGRMVFSRTSRPLTGAERARASALPDEITPEMHAAEMRAAVVSRDGRVASRGDEEAADLVRLLRTLPRRTL